MENTLTIINDNKLRGVIAPATVISEKRLADLIDLIEMSSPESVKEVADLKAEADKKNSWLSLDEAKKMVEENE